MIFEKQIIAMYKGMMYNRCDDNGTAFYFSAGDFPGLQKTPYSFRASAGHTLQGYLYCYEKYAEDRLIVFDHGFGGGHRSYMKEIELLCRRGYRVFAYDHTGCMESGGETPNGLAQSLCDLNDCVTTIKNDRQFHGLDLSIIGHSWGGFSTLNISALHPEISHVVVLSGFVSVEEMVNSFFSGIMKGYRKALMTLERTSNPRFVDCNAVDSLLRSRAKALLIYSDNDKLCTRKHFDILHEKLANRENTTFLLVSGKDHNPNYTKDAVTYLGEYVKAKNKLTRSKKPLNDAQKAAFVASYDWDRMTAQDDTVWNEIFRALES